MTNNPDKVNALRAEGIRVTEVVPIQLNPTSTTPHTWLPRSRRLVARFDPTCFIAPHMEMACIHSMHRMAPTVPTA